ncbi:hypothetical protein AB0F92_29050 [Kitasatospora aureofaciens]
MDGQRIHDSVAGVGGFTPVSDWSAQRVIWWSRTRNGGLSSLG